MATTVIVYDRLTTKEILEPTSKVQIALAALMLAILSTFPFLFAFIVWKNRASLDKIEI